MIKASESLKNCVVVITKTINAEAINFFLSSYCVEALYCAVRAVVLEISLNHVFKRSCVVCSWLESLQFSIELSAGVQPSRHRLTHCIRVELASINTHD